MDERKNESVANDDIAPGNEVLKEDMIYSENAENNDDGRRIADMNIEGMPWYVEQISDEERIKRAMEPTLNAKETRRVISSAVVAGLIVAAVFISGMALFLLFCLNVWFK